MRKQVVLLLLAVAGVSSACAAQSSARLAAQSPMTADRAMKVAHQSPAPATACAEWRLIGIRSRSAAECPAVPGWRVERLFAPARKGEERQRNPYGQPPAAAKADDRGISPDAALRELDRFCTYELEDGSPPSRGEVPVVNRDLVRVDRDCAALSIAGDAAVPEEVWRPASKQFLIQSGQPGTPLAVTKREGVRLAFLDTEPDGETVGERRGYSWHGYTMAWIARNLICSSPYDGPCAAKITTRLALPLASFDARSKAGTRVSDRGGHIGTQRDLAKAIFGEVDHWLALREDRANPQHLVLNVSLAWDPRLFAGLEEEEIAELQAGSQAVYRALQYAASEDVLVLAAAGNKKLCPGVPPEGPLLPAGWESKGPASKPCGQPAPPPLVRAVGGLGVDGGRLGIGRDGGMPPRAAYAENAVVPTWKGQQSAMYTGTSVATAVASAIAAIVWDTAPDLTPEEVMEVLETDFSGNDLTFAADFGRRSGSSSTTGAAPPRVHRLSLCHAVRAACARAGDPSCPVAEKCAELPDARTMLAQSSVASEIPTTCQPWLFPQPEEPPCPTCLKEPPR